MSIYRLAKAAEQDLEDLWVYLAEKSPIAADRQIGKLLNRLPMLAQFPNMGIERNDLLPGVRSFPSKAISKEENTKFGREVGYSFINTNPPALCPKNHHSAHPEIKSQICVWLRQKWIW
jgi:toxin ParE1/3/4